jgi:hypothetical protein
MLLSASEHITVSAGRLRSGWLDGLRHAEAQLLAIVL